MIKQEIHQIKGNQFPFGELKYQDSIPKKVLVRKRYTYKNQIEHSKLNETIQKLKTISHKNTINLRSAEDPGNGFIDLYYPYVHIPLEESFNQNVNQTVKEVHKQFIELTIYLAKNYILTSFNPNRCGIIVNGEKTLVKYYLPLSEIIVTNNLSMLERSVQLFSVQSMHYLDTLCQNTLNTSLQNSSQGTLRNRLKLTPEIRKSRRESQPTGLIPNRIRRRSTNPINAQQIRKLSVLSRELSEISQMYKKRTKQSTKLSNQSYNALKFQTRSKISEKTLPKSSSFDDIVRERLIKIKERSLLALEIFRDLRQRMEENKTLRILLYRAGIIN